MSLTLNLLLLLLLVLSHQAESGSIVKFLPGFEGPLPFELETGYIGIGKEEELQTFYYFIKSEKNPKEDPLLIWITGGPGCSSTSALFYENGPVTIKVEPYNGTIPSLISTPYSWTKFVNIIYVDQPTGVGFSYKRTPNNAEISDTIEVIRIHEFIQKWLEKHSEFSSNPFYVGGDSYSGKIIPAIVSQISKENYLCCKPPINLQGYILGNPVTDIEFEHNHQIPFSHGMALISDELYQSLKRICKGSYYNVDPRNTKCLKLVKEFHKCIDNIYDANVLLTNCDENSAKLLGPSCWVYRTTLVEYWANDEKVREALQIRKESVGEWHRCNYLDQYDGDIISSVPYHKYNSIKGYKSIIYSGDHDLKVPFASTQAWIRSLNYSIIDHWRPWMINGQVGGYTRTFANNMTYATIKGGGHTVEYTPKEGFIMFQRWISGQPL